MSQMPPFRPIRQRLLLWVGGLALCAAVVAAVVQTLLVSQQTRAEFQALTEDLARINLPLLTHVLWTVEPEVLEQQLALIAARPEVAGLVLESSAGLHLPVGEVPAGQEPDAVLSIAHPERAGVTLGELRLYADAAHLHQAVLRAVGQRLLELAVFTALIALLIGWLLRRELGEPLRALAGQVGRFSPGADQPALRLERPRRRWRDEIDLVVDGFESLQQSLRHYGQERDLAMDQLAAERDRLDRRVEQRTATLQRINGYLDLFSRTLMRCVHLPLGDYHDTMRQALRELAEHVGASACALATRSRDGEWRWQVVWSVHGDSICCSEGSLLGTGWNGSGWQIDPARPELRAYQLADGEGDNLLVMRDAPAPESEDERRYQQMAAEMLFSLLERWEHARQLEATRQELERLSRSDPLTGLANRRHFDLCWGEESRRVTRHRHSLSLLMIDVDHFKAFNDRYGHGHGDLCLMAVANCMLELFQRAGELPARLGGEEFAVLLPGCDEQEAAEAAERLRRAIFDLAIEHQGSSIGRVSVSIGHATHRLESGEPLSATLMQEADRALYAAKHAGRNRACSSAVI